MKKAKKEPSELVETGKVVVGIGVVVLMLTAMGLAIMSLLIQLDRLI